MIDFLRHKATLLGATLVASEEDLITVVPASTIWVFGPRPLVDQVLRRSDLTDLHIFELVRSDTGHWMVPAHAGSLPLRYLNQSVLGRVAEIGISSPPTSFTFEHEGWQLLNSALVRFSLGQLHAQNGFIEVRTDDMCASIHDSVMEDLDAGNDVSSETEIVVEGDRALLQERLKQQTTQVPGIHKRSQRKSKAVVDGLQLRLAGPLDAIVRVRADDTVSSVVGASYTAGVTVFLDDGLWSELFRCLAGSIYSTDIVHESPKWLTIGCGTDDLDQLLADLRNWRETNVITRDFRYRRWEVECPASEGNASVLLHVGNGIMSARSRRAVASHVAGRISIPAIQQYLKHRNLTADVSISDNFGSSYVELQGDVQILQGTSIAWRWRGTNYAMTFDPPDLAAEATSAKTPLQAHSDVPPEEAAPGDSPQRPTPNAKQRRVEASAEADQPATQHRVGDIVRVPLMPREDSTTPDPGLPLDPVHEPTAAVKLLEMRHDNDFGVVWTGIRVQDELVAEQVHIEPKEVHQGRYLQLKHALAPEVRLNSNKCSKHFPLPKSGTKARTSTEQQVAKDAKTWTETLRKHLKDKSMVYLIDASATRDDQPPPPPSTTDTPSPINPPNPTTEQHGHTQAERIMWKAPRTDASIRGVYTCMSPARGALLAARFGERDIFNLSVAVRATDADILTAKLAGGRTGAEEARARLNTLTTASHTAVATHTTRKRGLTDAPDPQDQPADSSAVHA